MEKPQPEQQDGFQCAGAAHSHGKGWVPLGRASTPAAITNPVTLPRNNRDSCQQPEVPTGTGLGALEAAPRCAVHKGNVAKDREQQSHGSTSSFPTEGFIHPPFPLLLGILLLPPLPFKLKPAPPPSRLLHDTRAHPQRHQGMLTIGKEL